MKKYGLDIANVSTIDSYAIGDFGSEDYKRWLKK